MRYAGRPKNGAALSVSCMSSGDMGVDEEVCGAVTLNVSPAPSQSFDVIKGVCTCVNAFVCEAQLECYL